jgi:hypothetical protein
MCCPVEPIDSIDDYLRKVNNDIKEWPEQFKTIWFRGDKDDEESLLPRIFKRSFNELIENDINQQFRMRAPALIQRTPQYERIDEWLFLMQHSNPFPTRLLDWTESALAALFFAINNCTTDKRQPIVWVLNPYFLNFVCSGRTNLPLSWNDGSNHYNKNNRGLETNIQMVNHIDANKPEHDKVYELKKCPANFCAAFGDGFFEEYFPLALFPQHIHPRVTAQKGCFTIHGKKHQPIDRILEKNKSVFSNRLSYYIDQIMEIEKDEKEKELLNQIKMKIATEKINNIILKRYTICSDKQLLKQMLFDLRTAGISQATLFPELDGLGKELATIY